MTKIPLETVPFSFETFFILSKIYDISDDRFKWTILYIPSGVLDHPFYLRRIRFNRKSIQTKVVEFKKIYLLILSV